MANAGNPGRRQGETGRFDFWLGGRALGLLGAALARSCSADTSVGHAVTTLATGASGHLARGLTLVAIDSPARQALRSARQRLQRPKDCANGAVG